MTSDPPRDTIRVDKWLWFARFFKTRTLAARIVSGGHLRVNGVRIAKPSAPVGAGDVLTFAQGDAIRVAEIRGCGTRRGPAPEAQALYVDRSPPAPLRAPAAPRFDGGGRPTKKDRRDMAAQGIRGRDRPLE